MKIHLYDYTEDENSLKFDQIIRDIKDKLLVDRNKIFNGKTSRIEDITIDNEIMFFQFVTLRMSHGPGKGGPESGLTSINLGPDEKFAEDTACLLSVNKNLLFVQYNHYGARMGDIHNYINQHNRENAWISLHPKLNASTEEQLLRQNYFKKFDITISPLTIRRDSDGISINEALNVINSQLEPKTVKMVLSSGRNYLPSEKAKNFLTFILSKISSGEIKSAKVTSSEELDDNIQVIDLVSQRLIYEYPIQLRPDGRWQLNDRYNLLKRALDEHARDQT